MHATRSAGGETRGHGKENPPNFCAVRFSNPTRVLSPRQLPTDHDYAVSTRGYQSDQPSLFPHRLLPALWLDWFYLLVKARVIPDLDKNAPYQNTNWALNWMMRPETADPMNEP